MEQCNAVSETLQKRKKIWRIICLILSYLNIFVGLGFVGFVIFFFTAVMGWGFLNTEPTASEIQHNFIFCMCADFCALTINLILFKCFYKVHKHKKQFIVFVVMTILWFAALGVWHIRIWL